VKIGKNAVKTKNIANKAVKTKKLAGKAVTEAKLAAAAVTAGKLADGAVTEAKVAPLEFTDASGFTNGWSASNALAPPQFAKDVQGIVHLRGNIAGGTNNTSAFTLPSGFRPNAIRGYAVTSGFATECTLSVAATGTVTPTGCNNLFVTLDPVTFVADGS
jgi:hypothetical protein